MVWLFKDVKKSLIEYLYYYQKFGILFIYLINLLLWLAWKASKYPGWQCL
jgi:hypothetical protein